MGRPTAPRAGAARVHCAPNPAGESRFYATGGVLRDWGYAGGAQLVVTVIGMGTRTQ